VLCHGGATLATQKALSMRFNSLVFIFLFLPVTWLGYQFLARVSQRLGFTFLVTASLVFYGWWNVRFLPLLVASVVTNFLAGEVIRRLRAHPRALSATVVIAISANIIALAYYKYLAAIITFLVSHSIPLPEAGHIALPLGISFFTFTQIAYLLDVAWGESVERDPLAYALFVTFFPHLIAGPIVHHGEMMPQFSITRRRIFSGPDTAVGISLFVLGLAKKVLIADPASNGVAGGFDYAQEVQFFTAWHAALSYSIQLYFDFSGYSDMAIGLARMFGIRFPLNFNSPYKATSVVEYWQRWHMTLTRYLTDYLFNPMALAVMHAIAARRRRQGLRMSRADRLLGLIVLPMMATMTIAGIWHGAGLQFVVFGVLHGVYLSVNHAWRIYCPSTRPPRAVTRAGSCLLTYLCVLVGAVFFRAASVPAALGVLAGMTGLHGIEGPIPIPVSILGLLSPITGFASAHGIVTGTDPWAVGHIYLRLVWLALVYLIIWTMPNTQQIMGRYRPALGWHGSAKLSFRMTPAWGFVIGVIVALAVLLPQQAEFIYFQF
jgi:alginate O-acetyltransferase complex protein AlgI